MSQHGRLRLLATTDLHMALRGWDYYRASEWEGHGLARLAPLLRAAREEILQTGDLALLFDNGDAQQGTPLGETAVTMSEQDNHPLMLCFDKLGYDAIGLGNHDFNFGLNALSDALSHAPCPVVCTNLEWHVPTPPSVTKSVVLNRSLQGRSIRIGVMGFIPPQTVLWDSHLLSGKATVPDIVDSAKREITYLQDTGCDIIVALAHSGIGSQDHEPGMENALGPLSKIAGLDAIIGGHTHEPFAGHLGDDQTTASVPPIALAGAYGMQAGQIDLMLEHTGARWQPTGSAVKLLTPAAAAPEARDVLDAIEPWHARTVALMDTRVGSTPQPLHSYFSLFGPDAGLAAVAAAQAEAVREQLDADVPLLSAVAPCKFGGRNGPTYYTDVPRGPITLRHLADLHIYPNELRALEISGAVLFEWLEKSASCYTTIAPEATGQPLLDPAFPSHNFDVIFGISYKIDLRAAPRYTDLVAEPISSSRRISEVRYLDQPVQIGDRFIVVTNNYRANGGGNFPGLPQQKKHLIRPQTILDALSEWVRRPDHARMTYPQQPWRFAPIPGSEVLVRTGLGARGYLGQLPLDKVKRWTAEDDYLHLSLAL